jgi:hypothetical protein
MKGKYHLNPFTKPIVLAVFLFFVVASLCYADVPRMTKEDLKIKLGNSDVVVLDVRRGKDWTASEFKIQGAVRTDPSDFNAWKDQFTKDKTLVLYCA